MGAAKGMMLEDAARPRWPGVASLPEDDELGAHELDWPILQPAHPIVVPEIAEATTTATTPASTTTTTDPPSVLETRVWAFFSGDAIFVWVEAEQGLETRRETALFSTTEASDRTLTSRDPVLFGGGDFGLYVYVYNDPINLIDSTGEQRIGVIITLEILYILSTGIAVSSHEDSGALALALLGHSASNAAKGIIEEFAASRYIYGPYGQVSRAALEAAASCSSGPTTSVATSLTQLPVSGRALSVATGPGAEALANAARTGGQVFRADIPTRLIVLLEDAGLVTRSTTLMNGVASTELSFAPQATEFVVQFFQ